MARAWAQEALPMREEAFRYKVFMVSPAENHEQNVSVMYSLLRPTEATYV